MPDDLIRDPVVYLRSRREDLTRTHGITSLRGFGSRARGDARPDSDIDFGLIAIEQEMSEDLKPGIGAYARAEPIKV